MLLLSGSSNRDLAAAGAARLGVSLGDCEFELFPGGELSVNVREPMRGRAVYIIQSTSRESVARPTRGPCERCEQAPARAPLRRQRPHHQHGTPAVPQHRFRH